MLRVGLTGGIGAGKSTVGRRLAERGAYLIDADALARAAVAPGTDGLAEVVAAFGPQVLEPDGELDRPAMAAIVFADPAARALLNAIVHPRVAAGSAELLAAAAPDAVVVQEIPLLVENDLGAAFQLVIGVHAPVQERVDRLVAQRRMTRTDATARIAAQADDAARRAACDVWLDNSGDGAGLATEVDRLWDGRLVPFEANLRQRRTVPGGPPRLVGPDPSWPDQAARLARRIAAAAGSAAIRVDHVGSTAVPGLPARDVLDLQLGVASLADADDLRVALEDAGFPHRADITTDRPYPAGADPDRWRKRYHSGADPGRPVHLHVRVVGSAGWRYALQFRDWLRSDAHARREYAALKYRLAAKQATDADAAGYTDAKEPWFQAVWPQLLRWSAESGWRPPVLQTAVETHPPA